MSASPDRSIWIIAFIALSIWLMVPPPPLLSLPAWHCLIIFIAMIASIITSKLPISFIVLLGSAVAMTTHTLSFQQIFSEFGSRVVWMVVFAFFIARGFISTGLGHRMAYWFIARLGHSTLGLAYGLMITEYLLAPLIPSVAARSGGIIYPVTQSIIQSYARDPQYTEEEVKSTGAFLINVCHHSSIVCSAMFMTAMAGNPLIADLAKRFGIDISWSLWAYAALLPGLVSCALLPLLVRMVTPPAIQSNPQAPMLAEKELERIGALSRHESIMLALFAFLVSFWMGEPWFGIDPTTVTLCGVLVLVLSGIMPWHRVVSEHSAWDTMIWFAILLAFSTQLNQLGVMTWVASIISAWVTAFGSPLAIGTALLLMYFYMHYFFASLTAHITVFYSLVLNIMIHASLPPLASALILGYLSNLYGGLTHYGSSASPIFFASGYQSVHTWWRVGFWMCSWNFLIWTGLAYPWFWLIGIL